MQFLRRSFVFLGVGLFSLVSWPFRMLGRIDGFGWLCLCVVLAFPAASAALFLTTVRQVPAGGCPLVFDIDGSGVIEITGHVATREKLYSLSSIQHFVEFDIFADGKPRNIDWIAADTDAFLIDLRMGLPSSIDGRHLFGTAGWDADTRFDDGFAKLAALDVDRDGFVAGPELDGLALWRDNGDAKLAQDEILELSDYGIVSIPVRPRRDRSGPYGLERIYALAQRTSDAPKMLVEDIWFMTDEQPVPVDTMVARWITSVF